MRSKSRKSLAVLLASTMVLSTVVLPGMAIPTAAAQFSDTQGHWAEASITRWSDNKIVQGADGRFNPDAFMTRAEMATVLTNLLGLQETAQNTFGDVASGAWYESAVLKCAAAGIMKGDGTNANPNANITREQATTMLGRALAINPTTGDLTFTDKATIADYAQGYVKAMSEKGIIKGISEGVFGAKSNIDRAAVVTILDRSITTYANVKDATVTAKDKGITLVTATGVTVSGTAEDLLIAQGAASATTTLKDAKVTGTATVNAAKATVKMTGSSTANQVAIAANATGVALNLDKTAKITTLTTAADSFAVSGTGSIATMTVTAGKDVKVAKETSVTKLENKGTSDVKYGDKTVAAGKTEQPSGGGGGGGGGGSTPVTPPVSGEFTTLDELKANAAKPAGDTTLTVSPDATITGGNATVDAVATGTLTIDFGTIKADNITINALDATAINLNDAVTGGAKFKTLTINAPKAHVINNVDTDSVTVAAVGANSFELRASTTGVAMNSAGALIMGLGTNRPTVTIGALNGSPVTLKGNDVASVTMNTGAKLEMNTSAPTVTLNGAGAEITMGGRAIVSTFNVTASATIKNDGTATIGAVTTSADLNLMAAAASIDVTAGLNNVTMTLASGVILPLVTTASNLTFAGQGSVSAVDVTATNAGTLNVNATGTTKIDAVSAIGGGTVSTTSTGSEAMIPEKATQKAAKPTSSEVKFVAPTAVNGKGSINVTTLTATNLEYREQNTPAWTAMTATPPADLAAGTYYVRVKEVKGTSPVLASEPICGIIPQAVGVKTATITGKALVGETLTATANADANGIITYQWKAGTANIDKATNPTFVLTDDQVGKVITVAITNYATSTATSTATVAVTADKTALTKAINAANAAKSGVTISELDAAKVAQGVFFVKQAEMDALDNAIKAAAPKETMTTTEVNTAITTLNTAVTTFNTAKKTGTLNEVAAIQKALTDAVTAANANKATASVKTNGATVKPTDFWVSQTTMTTYETAITTADAAKTETVAKTLSNAIKALNTATGAFNAKKHNGMTIDTSTLGLTIKAANDNIASVTATDDATTVAPSQKYVSIAAKKTYVDAIAEATKALTTHETQSVVDAAITALTAPTDAFNAEKKPGTKGDPTKLLAAVEQATIACAAITVSVDGTDVAAQTAWVTKDVKVAYAAAILAAKDYTGDQTALDGRLKTLQAATTAFNQAKKFGKTISEDTIDRIINSAIYQINPKMTAYAEISTLDTKNTATVKMKGYATTVSQVYKDIVTTLQETLKANSDKVTTMKIGTAKEIDITKALTPEDIKDLIKDSGLGVAGTDSLKGLDKKELKVQVTTTNNTQAKFTYNVKFEAVPVLGIVTDGIKAVNTKIADYASITIKDRAAAVTIATGKEDTLVTQVYTDIITTLVDTLKSNAATVKSIKIGDVTLNVNETVTAEKIQSFVKASGLKGADGKTAIKGTDPISVLLNKMFVFKVTDTASGEEDYSISFAKATQP